MSSIFSTYPVATDYLMLSVLIGGSLGIAYGLVSSIEEYCDNSREDVLVEGLISGGKSAACGFIGAVVAPTLPLSLPLYLFYSHLSEKRSEGKKQGRCRW